MRADQVGREKVGGELDALELRLDGGGKGLDAQGLGESRHAFQQDVAVGEKADQQPFDHVLLADDHLADLHLQGVDKRALALDLLVDGLDIE